MTTQQPRRNLKRTFSQVETSENDLIPEEDQLADWPSVEWILRTIFDKLEQGTTNLLQEHNSAYSFVLLHSIPLYNFFFYRIIYKICTTPAPSYMKKQPVLVLYEKYERFIGDVVCNRILPNLSSTEQTLLEQVIQK